VLLPGEVSRYYAARFCFKGTVGIVSKCGTLTYKATDQVVKQGLNYYCFCNCDGDFKMAGTTTKEAVELLMNDREYFRNDGIEIGGQLKQMLNSFGLKADGNHSKRW
jgi:succinyl-CoA synthetase alpha subunit